MTERSGSTARRTRLRTRRSTTTRRRRTPNIEGISGATTGLVALATATGTNRVLPATLRPDTRCSAREASRDQVERSVGGCGAFFGWEVRGEQEVVGLNLLGVR